MKRKAHTAYGVYTYLETSGILENGSPEDIALMRKKYWNERKRQANAEKRKHNKEFKVYLNPAELQIVTRAARTHTMSRTSYIKQAALSYTTKQYLIPDPSAVLHIKQLLSLNYDLLREIADDHTLPSQAELIRTMAQLEQTVLAALCDPPAIEDAIRERAANNPDYKNTLLQLLQKL